MKVYTAPWKTVYFEWIIVFELSYVYIFIVNVININTSSTLVIVIDLAYINI